MNNFILNTDSYKASHFLQYPPATTHVSSYIESRGGSFGKTTFFGLQMFIKSQLSQPVSHADVDEARDIITAHGLPFNESGWRYIVDEHGGYLPLEIQAVAEGTVLDTGNVLVQLINTDPRCAWLTSYVETALLRGVWYPTTVATLSWHSRALIQRFMEQTSDNNEGIEFKLHDFGARGVSSGESAALGAAAHLVSFMGTDTLAGIMAARRYYGAGMPGFSIPAAEHSTITAWGKEHESDAFANMVAQFGGNGNVFAVVSDSYDLWNAVDTIWGSELKARVETNGGTLVVRPDSGDPVSIVTEAVERLMGHFGFRVNSKGYRVLPDCVRVIQGDGISLQTIEAILRQMEARKQSADNIAFGMGGELLQKVHRDTQKFAMKASAIKLDGFWRDVYKAPATDRGKQSKRGRLALIKDADGKVRTIREQDLGQRENLLRTVFRNGELLLEQSFDDVRETALQGLSQQA